MKNKMIKEPVRKKWDELYMMWDLLELLDIKDRIKHDNERVKRLLKESGLMPRQSEISEAISLMTNGERYASRDDENGLYEICHEDEKGNHWVNELIDIDWVNIQLGMYLN